MGRWLLVVLAGCGRIAFDPLGDGGVIVGDGATLGDGRVSDAGLLAYYKLDDLPGDGVLDSTGNGHNGVCAAGCPGVGSLAKVGTASYDFNGSSTYIEIVDAPDLHPAELTVACWVNVRTQGPHGFVQKPLGAGAEDSWELFVDPSGLIGVCVRSSCAYSSAQIPTNSWHHIAFVAVASTQQLYVDGVAEVQSASTLDWDGNDLLIGADIDNGTPIWYVDGRIDDIRIYGRALAAAEIAALAAQ